VVPHFRFKKDLILYLNSSRAASSGEFKFKDKDDMEIIYLAEQEATKAERFALRYKSSPKEKQKCGKKYSAILKDYIQYLKYTTKFKLPEDPEYQLFL
jgi:hypothetical protein